VIAISGLTPLASSALAGQSAYSSQVEIHGKAEPLGNVPTGSGEGIPGTAKMNPWAAHVRFIRLKNVSLQHHTAKDGLKESLS
jgi:hypothetical protein